jgi:(p)ppGpp synthase/HD superfamily hydrolase
METNIVSIARDIARNAHKGQRYGEKDYFTAHVQSVVLQLYDTGTDDPRVIATAYLHDVLEDTDVTAGNLKEKGIPADVVLATQLLTKVKGVSEFDYFMAISKNPLALRVKVADAAVNARGGRAKYKLTAPLLEALLTGELKYDPVT